MAVDRLKVLYVSTSLVFATGLLLLGLELGLGITGIVKAKNGNNCTDSDSSTICITSGSLSVPLADSNLADCETQGDELDCILSEEANANESVEQFVAGPSGYLKWMIGASCVSVPVAAVVTILLVLFVEMIIEESRHAQKKHSKEAFDRINSHINSACDEQDKSDEERERGLDKEKKKKKEKEKEDGEDRPDQEYEIRAGGGEGKDSTDGGRENSIKFKEDLFGSTEHEWKAHGPLRRFDAPSAVTLFLAFLSFNCAILCLMWSIALGYEYYNSRSSDAVWLYFTVDMLVGIVLPIFVFVFAVLFSVLLDFISMGRVDPRKALKVFLPSVDFRRAKQSNYWIVEDIFYFPVKKHVNRRTHGCLYSLDRNVYTWCLVLLVILTFFLAFSHFVNISVIDERVVSSCDELVNPFTYNCFTTNKTFYNYREISCAEMSDGALAYCFRFLRFGVDVNPFNVFSVSFAFYLAAVALFTTLFKVVKVVMTLKPSKYWSFGFFIIGGAIFFTSLVISLIRDTLSIKASGLQLAQVFIIALHFLLIGFLIFSANWWERVNKRNPQERLLLVKFSNTTSAVLSRLEQEREEEEAEEEEKEEEEKKGKAAAVRRKESQTEHLTTETTTV